MIIVENGNKLFCILSKQTQKFWKENKKAFENLALSLGDKKKIIEFLAESDILGNSWFYI